MRAVEKYDYRKAINSALTLLGGSTSNHRAIADQARTIRIPVHMIESIN